MINLKLRKPKMSSEQLVLQLKEKGVKFNLFDENNAVLFLKGRNNYLRLASYRKNYEKDSAGKYINLDFEYLVELSKIDMYMRNYIIKMCIDIEHCLKIKLLQFIESNSDDNGYDVVNEFLSLTKNRYILDNIARFSFSHYNGELVNSYFDVINENGHWVIKDYDCPAWVLIELLQFGDFLNFYQFYFERYGILLKEISVYNLVKSLRNACAHNNCILRNLHKSENTYPPAIVSKYISGITSIGKQLRKNRLSSTFTLEFSSLLCVYSQIVSDDIRKHTYSDLQKFASDRLIKNISYYDDNYMVKSTIEFIKKTIDNLSH